MMTLHTKLLLLFMLFSSQLCAAGFPLVTPTGKVSILYYRNGPHIDSITAHLLAADIERVTAYRPQVITNLANAKGNVIVIGSLASPYVRKILGTQSGMYKGLAGKWECYGFKVINKPVKNIANALVIAGSDSRGTAYGVFTLSEKIGVSPWYWWADVPVQHMVPLTVVLPDVISMSPSVKYRGIFINDEDWGLQPWAAKTFEKETGDIGPKTYAKVFELLLRLKANLVWPAMHPSTKAFYSYPENKTVAADYAIVIGSSHAEPMLRNNVSEWDVKTMGAFNYITNKDRVYKYWEDRVKESSGNDAIYTMGMRGVHDSGIEGVKDAKEAVPLLERIMADQRGLLQKYVHKKITAIPQAFTAYKEVLDIYDNNLQLPGDVTLVWPDDNYGYIQRLNNAKEQQRPGGSGVYYHASYWGRPHDYLWLSTTHPALIREEMMKAYTTGADRLWVLNVGDIKPLEYNIQLFMDMAYNARPFKESGFTKTHLHNWISQIFGAHTADTLSDIVWKYYQLAFERRPEFMGWSQTEPTTKTTYTAYNHFYYGDEAQRRIDAYSALQQQVNTIRKQMDAAHAAAFYELVYYPVTGAALMNKKFLYRDKAWYYSKQNRRSAFDYATLSKLAYDSIVKETDYYNNQLAGGKWEYIMSMQPRELPVYQEPAIPQLTIDTSLGWSVAPEGFVTKDSAVAEGDTQKLVLPHFSSVSRHWYFIDIFLCGNSPVQWTASSPDNWIRLSQQQGMLVPEAGKNQLRLWVAVDWSKMPKSGSVTGQIIFSGAGKQISVQVQASGYGNAERTGYNGFVENNGYVSIYPNHYNRKDSKPSGEWKALDGLGYTGASLEAIPSQAMNEGAVNNIETIKSNASYVEYDFFTITHVRATVSVYTLPTQPLNNRYSVRYGVCVDDGPVKVLDAKISGRSEEWKQNVLRNNAVKKFETPVLEKGKHTLRIYMIDPGVILDRMTIDLGGLKDAYGVIPETR